MSDVPVPWVGLAAIAAMFVIPFLPAWLFEGPRVVRHHPTRHVCADCGTLWTRRHQCPWFEPVVPLHAELQRPSRGQLTAPVHEEGS